MRKKIINQLSHSSHSTTYLLPNCPSEFRQEKHESVFLNKKPGDENLGKQIPDYLSPQKVYGVGNDEMADGRSEWTMERARRTTGEGEGKEELQPCSTHALSICGALLVGPRPTIRRENLYSTAEPTDWPIHPVLGEWERPPRVVDGEMGWKSHRYARRARRSYTGAPSTCIHLFTPCS